jgi:SAM domain (Sterile alpha motif)
MNCNELKGKADASRRPRQAAGCAIIALPGLTLGVGDWLRSLDVGQYEAVFRESEIDPEVLPELTGADLERLGVPLGHRKRLLKAISNLASPGQPTPSGAA